MSLREHALQYAEKGWPVFPCNGKKPYTEHGYKDATTDPDIIRKYWEKYPNANIGFAVPENIVVLDVDIKHDQGKYGDETLAALIEKNEPLPATVESLTGGGGRHLFFLTDKPVPCANGFLPALDLKSKGGFVVLPPSNHPDTGQIYEWEASSSPFENEMAPLPDWLCEQMMEKPKAALIVPEQIPQGQRNDVLFRMGCSMHAKGCSEMSITAALCAENQERCIPPLPEREVRDIARNISRYPAGLSGAYPAPNIWPHVDDKKKPIKHWENTRWICREHGIIFRYNELTKEIETDHTDFKGLSADSVITELRGICARYGYNLTKQDADDHILRMGENERFHPVRDYLNECMAGWDGKSRIRELFEMFILNPDSEQDPELLYILFEKWLISCALLVFNNGNVSAQGVLVLVGEQGIGKTRFFFRLLPNPEWGKSGRMIDMRDKDTVMQALGYWIVELGEYGRSLSAEKSDHYKAFITENCDVFRIPYAKKAEKHPRTTVFYATTDTEAFLRDDAGERRNWIISILGFKDVTIDIDQLWGEVAHMALVEKKPHWLNQDEIARLNAQNEAYKVRSAEYEILCSALDWDAEWPEWITLTATEVCKALCIDPRRSGHVGRALTQLAARGVKKLPDTSLRKYYMPPFLDSVTMSNVRLYVKDWQPQLVSSSKKQ